MNRNCTVICLDEIKLVGVKIRFDADSRGLYDDSGMNPVCGAVKKLTENGTLRLLAGQCGAKVETVYGARTNVEGDGVYDLVVGVAVESFDSLPPHLPEHAVKTVIPAKKYVRIEINEDNLPERQGFESKMSADDYFIGDFRGETDYVFDRSGVSFNVFEGNGRLLYKYEPIKTPADYAERMDTFVLTPVTLPDILCACSVDGPDGEFVITKFFKVEDKVFLLESAAMYKRDYYGFPINPVTEPLVSAFGNRVASFDGLPDCVEGHIVPGGLYLHIWQHEPNGDNPSMCYDVAFNHLDKLFFGAHPEYSRDAGRQVIARFKQANHASVFVPLLYNGSRLNIQKEN